MRHRSELRIYANGKRLSRKNRPRILRIRRVYADLNYAKLRPAKTRKIRLIRGLFPRD